MYELRWSSSNVGVLVMVNSRPFWASCMMNWGSTAHPIPFPCTWQASPGRCWASPGTPRIHRGPLDWNMYNFVCWLHLKSILLYPNCLRFNSIWMDRVPTEVVVQRGWHTCSLKVLGIQAPASARKWLGSVQVLHLWSCKVCQLVSFYPVQIWVVVETFRSLYCSETWYEVLSTVPGVQWNCFPGKQNTFQTSPKFHAYVHIVHGILEQLGKLPNSILDRDVPSVLNPLCQSCQMDEDMVGHIAALSRSSVPSSVHEKTIGMYLMNLQAQW